jgi:hypothetical protein
MLAGFTLKLYLRDWFGNDCCAHADRPRRLNELNRAS